MKVISSKFMRLGVSRQCVWSLETKVVVLALRWTSQVAMGSTKWL